MSASNLSPPLLLWPSPRGRNTRPRRWQMECVLGTCSGSHVHLPVNFSMYLPSISLSLFLHHPSFHLFLSHSISLISSDRWLLLTRSQCSFDICRLIHLSVTGDSVGTGGTMTPIRRSRAGALRAQPGGMGFINNGLGLRL